ncbi:EcsC family protein [Robertmurraya yapensis]|uniref:EcsC family protein n=1 Tax=Bacillus yapensis TaxID=2492960 RepID=A0A3S0JY18_9BACI|nr:EcsC family protein [Bacillus yapensis]RTR31433.1 EcsC family protein [Bacillus yapensis]TKS95657.1 EcsC family protein [Bacillus yapensis]
MTKYELQAYEEIQQWKRKLLKRANLVQRISKKAQVKINEKIPEKAHQIITDAIKNMVKMTIAGSSFTTKMNDIRNMSLEDRDKELEQKISLYRKTATIEGAGTGAAGLLVGLADFPLLLSIKMKFLFEAAAVYGFDTKEYEERLFILHVFKLAFSSDEKRRETLEIIENWEERKKEIIDMDWQEFQQEYRDYIDFVKMLQLVPGIGAVVGAYANYNLLDQLGEVAKNAYRIRILGSSPKLY